MSFPKAPKNRRIPSDDWDRTIVTFQSPYRLKDLTLPFPEALLSETKGNNQSFKLRFSGNRRDEANKLIERMYEWRGYSTTNLDGALNQITLTAHQDEQIAGTLTLNLDSAEGLMADQAYSAELDKLRAAKYQVCELGKLAINPDSGSKHLLAALIHLAYIYAKIHGQTDFVIEVNPRHADFYKKMLGFKLIGAEKLCSRVNAPSILLHLEFSYIEEHISKFGGRSRSSAKKSLYPYFFSKEDEAGITNRLLQKS